MQKKAPIYTIDSLMNQGQLKFSEACQGYRLIRKGWSIEEALHIINTRKGKKEKKHMKKSKNTESLETLVGLLNQKANDKMDESIQIWAAVCKRRSGTSSGSYHFKILEGLTLSDETPKNDALNHIDTKATTKLNNPKISEDALDLCYSNTDGVEVLF
jgi:hypothetical protein